MVTSAKGGGKETAVKGERKRNIRKFGAKTESK
jgi:hypothetical protein